MIFDVRQNILELIDEYRRINYCSKTEMAQKIGVKRNFVYDLENKDIPFNPRLSTLRKVADFFGVSISYLTNEGGI